MMYSKVSLRLQSYNPHSLPESGLTSEDWWGCIWSGCGLVVESTGPQWIQGGKGQRQERSKDAEQRCRKLRTRTSNEPLLHIVNSEGAFLRIWLRSLSIIIWSPTTHFNASSMFNHCPLRICPCCSIQAAQWQAWHTPYGSLLQSQSSLLPSGYRSVMATCLTGDSDGGPTLTEHKKRTTIVFMHAQLQAETASGHVVQWRHWRIIDLDVLLHISWLRVNAYI